ncbi:F-actin-monooxygenase MICAL1 [Trichosurus vulpecula]|uniref:F-actin-monooxygenase MICAL1 n=1 Tax=Trichosurus vulpecula TaxID=9337 RepID=UPI00186B5354|nr:F-actin-monooxygenase MICAL1 [Trichosurus vulpecula]
MAAAASQNPAHGLFENFLQAQLCKDVLSSFQDLCMCLGLEPGGKLSLYHKLKAELNYWNAKSLWAKLDKRASHPVYEQGKACANTQCLVVGAGPCGLRTAVELALLGARVVLVEKRTKFSRHNVLHLWPFTIHDLRGLGAKKFYGRFCTGTLDHISIRQLQLLLLKVALLLGVEIHWGVTFTGLLPPSHKGSGWRAQLQPSPPDQLAQYKFDVLISAAGSKFVPEGFTVREMRGKLAIGITANFVNGRTVAETQVPEISGVARIYNQSFFQNLFKATGIDLENIVYYKDDTHYFVMTAKKQSLLRLGVLRQDFANTEQLLGRDNIVPEALHRFARAAADFATHGKLGNLEFACDARGRPDVAAFDFTSMTRAESAARVQEKHGARVLLQLVGDCLVEPFWPLGTGVARGFLAAFDAAWTVKLWAGGAQPLDVLAERESLYQLLSQTSPENMHRNIAQYTLDPASRYPNLNLRSVTPQQVRDLYDIGGKELERKKNDKTDSLTPPAPGPVGTQEELLLWCQKQTAGYPGVQVTDFSSSWTDGRALCALVHRLRPNLLDFSTLKGAGALETTALAVKLAEQELGIAPVIPPQVLVAGTDPLGLAAYLTHFYSAFGKTPHSPGPVGPLSTGTANAILFLSKLQRTLQRNRSQENGEDSGGKKPRLESEDKMLSPTEPALLQPVTPLNPLPADQEAETGDSCWCSLCGERLYILERICADGRFFHRSCFRCHSCEAPLWPEGYRQHPGDGHFYCLLHFPQSANISVCDGAPKDQEVPGKNEEKEATAVSPRTPTAPQEMEGPPKLPSRKLIRLSSPERRSLSSLNFHPDEMEGPPKPPRSCSVLARQALEESFTGWGVPDQRLPQILLSPPPELLSLVASNAEEEDKGLSSSEEDQEGEEEDLVLTSDVEQTLLNFAKNSGTMKEYPTWRRTLLRRAKEEEMKRFCKAQAIQRRLDEIEASLRELEEEGKKLELALRNQSSSQEQEKLQMGKLLNLIQKKNSLVAEEADLMITVRELGLEEQQWQLDQELRSYMDREETLKTAKDKQAEEQLLKQLLEVVKQRDNLIRFREECRLSELVQGPGDQG